MINKIDFYCINTFLRLTKAYIFLSPRILSQVIKYINPEINYRHISPYICTVDYLKVFERVIHKQIVTFLISKGHLNPTQDGFSGGCSCLSALLSVFDDVMQLLSSGNYTVDMVCLDFSTCVQDVRIGYIQDVLVFETLRIIVKPMARSVPPV